MTETNPTPSPEMPNKVAAEVIMKNDIASAEAQQLKAAEDKRGWLDKLVNRKKQEPPDPKKVVPKERLDRIVADRNNKRQENPQMGPEEFGMNLNEDGRFKKDVAERERQILSARGPNKITGAPAVLSPIDRLRARQDVINKWAASKDIAIVGRLDLYQKEGIYLKKNGEVDPYADPFFKRHQAIVAAEPDSQRRQQLTEAWVKQNRSKAELYANCDVPGIKDALDRIDLGQETKVAPPDPNKPVKTDSVMKARLRANLQQKLTAVEQKLKATPNDNSLTSEKTKLTAEISALNTEPKAQDEINSAVTNEVTELMGKEAHIKQLESDLQNAKNDITKKSADLVNEVDTTKKQALIAEVVGLSAQIPAIEAEIATAMAELDAIAQDLKKPEAKGNKVNAGLLLALTALSMALPLLNAAMQRNRS